MLRGPTDAVGLRCGCGDGGFGCDWLQWQSLHGWMDGSSRSAPLMARIGHQGCALANKTSQTYDISKCFTSSAPKVTVRFGRLAELAVHSVLGSRAPQLVRVARFASAAAVVAAALELVGRRTGALLDAMTWGSSVLGAESRAILASVSASLVGPACTTSTPLDGLGSAAQGLAHKPILEGRSSGPQTAAPGPGGGAPYVH